MFSGCALKAENVFLIHVMLCKRLVFEQGSPEVCRGLFCLNCPVNEAF